PPPLANPFGGARSARPTLHLRLFSRVLLDALQATIISNALVLAIRYTPAAGGRAKQDYFD
ncbi:MAG: hypothetical protein U9N87_00540, partial [Planctomycetota bacterium]|nr:hypothetical protein [Planctomycetota bacterium]